MVKAAGQKILLVGEARICQQVVYVLDFPNYDMAEKLTTENYEQYRDHQIYVCEFKRKSRDLVARELVKTVQGIQYLDDICRTIDKEYTANRRRHKRETRQNRKQEPRVRQSPFGLIRQQIVNFRQGFGPKSLYRVALFPAIHAAKHRHYDKVKGHHLKYLRFLKPSELFLYVLYAQPNPQIQCTVLETDLYVDRFAQLDGCCGVKIPLGNLHYDGELDEIYHSTYARIIKLSSLNRSYCLCNFTNSWCPGYCHQAATLPAKTFVTPSVPQNLTISFDRACNLSCKSCRNRPYYVDQAASQFIDTTTNKLLRSEYLEQTQNLVMAGMGEVFYSPHYRQLLTSGIKRNKIMIFTNGTLLNEDNWRLVANQYKTISVMVSIDAATPETYQKLRGGNFAALMQNLKMLGDLRRQGKIQWLCFNYVVQRDNFREMPAFIELGRAIGVDSIQFQHMCNMGNLTQKEFQERSLIIERQYFTRELWELLQDPIFQDPIVNLSDLQRYIELSKKHYC